MSNTTTGLSRRLTPAEMARCIRKLREMHQWSQEQLAEIAKLNVRTIQRVEKGASDSSLDTLRALALAFGSDDIDVLSRPVPVPEMTEEEQVTAKAEFDKHYVMLDAHAVTSGRQLADLAEANQSLSCGPAFDPTRPIAEEIAHLADYLGEYMDCADLYTQVQKLDIYDELQAHVDNLDSMGVCLRYGMRSFKATPTGDSAGIGIRILHVLAYEKDQTPTTFPVPRRVQFKP
ncbi:helix-turn-helix transcriptional regulator [Stenotrophomonas maltophilia]|jgi:transcriptional regulator with XRE-family HTH domain|uniref:helix-turn-helix transcriptional regulator n=1 Tax=Stenotrophomonas maltophilia TaxID=40324 RepID=UPI0015E043F9|nr:helix-turn-helix transcriptional regulator [Stenotrophomonas maltophilia]MBA0239812.1 XRE family transcriptional regulator [Stenotrophomonas maltophilia]